MNNLISQYENYLLFFRNIVKLLSLTCTDIILFILTITKHFRFEIYYLGRTRALQLRISRMKEFILRKTQRLERAN